MLPGKKKRYAVIIIALFCFMVVTGIGNYRAKQLAIEMAADQVNQTLAIAAARIDTVQLQIIMQNRDQKDPYYQTIRSEFLQLRKEHHLANIFIVFKDQDNQWYYVADAREDNDPQHKVLGTVEKRPSVSVQNTLKGKEVYSEYYGSSSGAVISGYQQLKDSQGKAFAVIGGDFAAEKMTDYLFTTRYAQFGLVAVGLILIGSVLLIAGRK